MPRRASGLSQATLDVIAAEERQRFERVEELHNHWKRLAGPPTYYWYLTFDGAAELHSLIGRYRNVMAFPYFDFVPADTVHVTLDRIGAEHDITPDQLQSITAAATVACQGVGAFTMSVGGFGGTPGAIGFAVRPTEPVEGLRDALRAATLAECPAAQRKPNEFRPHVAIAYCNSDGISPRQTVAAVRELDPAPFATVTVRDAALVLLDRGDHAYVWRTVERIPLRD